MSRAILFLLMVATYTGVPAQCGINIPLRELMKQKPDETLGLFEHCDNGAEQQILDLGGTIQYRVGKYLCIRVAAKQVEALAACSGVNRIDYQLSKPVVLNDTNRQINNVDSAFWGHAPLNIPLDGSNVLMGIIDGGIDFNQENWLPGYSAREGTGEGKAYVSFLKETIGNPRVIGVLVNNTYNWYSMAIPGTPCSLVPPSDNNLHIAEVVEDKPFHRIEINIGVSKEKFRTDWYDAYTGYWLGYEIDKTSSGGILRLEYPDLDYTYHPIALFKIIKKDEPIFIQPLNQIQEANSSLQDTATNTIVKNEISEIYISPEPVANVSAYPNPTMGITKLLIHPELLGNMWFLSDIYGRILMHGVATSTDYEFDFSSFSKGVYLFKVLTKNESTEIKIIRM